MNITNFMYFIEVVKRSSYTKAAEALFVSQSTISKAIKQLERKYDAEFIDRTAQTFKLTSAGKIFYTSAVKIVQDYQSETEILMARLHSRRGTLTLGVPPVTITAVYPLLYQYRSMYPEIFLNISEGGAQTVYSLTKNGTLDIGIIIQPFDDPDFNQVPVMYSEVMCVVPLHHRLANYKTISFEKLKNENFLLLNNTFMIHDLIINKCEEAGFKPHVTFESAQWDLLVEAVSNGQGITILPRPIIDAFCLGKVKALHLIEPVFPWIPTLVYHKEKFLTSPIKLFIDMIKSRDVPMDSENWRI